MCLASRLSMSPPPMAYSSKPLTSPATWQVRREGSNFVMRPMPGLPALIDSHAAALPFPLAQIIPMPVTTTFSIFIRLSIVD